MKKSHLIHRLFTVLIPSLVFGLAPLHAQLAPAVAESNGIVAVEVERAPAHGGWESRTNISGYSGTAFYYMGGADSFNSPGNALLEYPIVISTAGAYQLQLRSRIAFGTNNTEHNDTFARLVNVNGTAVAPIANSNTAHGTHWYKIYTNDLNVWTWNSSNRDHDPKSLAWNLTAGTYRIQLSKRSMGHAVDRIVLWNRGLHNLASTSTGKSANNTALNNLANSPDVVAPTPRFDKANDLFIAQFDGRPDADDIHAQAAIGSLLQHPEFNDLAHVYGVHNAYGKQSGVIHDSRTLMAMIFGGPEGAHTWTDANTPTKTNRTNPASKWAISVNRIADKAQSILTAGGSVWVMEAGQSDITASWVAELISRGVSESVIKQNVYVVQHSTWNENQASAGLLDYVKLKTTYVKISDGNHKNDTPDYHTDTNEIAAHSILRANAKTLANPNPTTRALWTEADRIIGSWTASYSTIPQGGIDFSDVAEAWWIFELNNAFTIPDFFSKYVLSTPITPPVVLRDPENPPFTQAGIEWERFLGNWSALPNFDALTAAAQGTTSVIGLGLGEPADYYAYRFNGYIDVPVDGTYTFYTSSDDGSKLYIGTTEVVNNDGVHAVVEKSGSIGLKAGKHAMTVTFFERTGANVLNVYWQGPGLAKQEIPASALLRSAESNTPPVANAGADQTVTDTDNSGSVNVTLNGSGSIDPDGTIVNYVWKIGTTQIATSVSPTVTLAVGTHTITLTVTDNSGATETDTVVVTVNSAPQDGEIVFAVNAGGGAFTGTDGTAYSADTNFSGGAIYTKNNAIAGTQDDVLYQSERYGNFSYNIPLENGEYEVVLKFAEIYWTAVGKRIFDASIEGSEVISNLDIFSQVGTNAAYDAIIPVTVGDGVLNITFNADVNNAKISAILVRKAENTPATHALTVNSGSGGGVYTAGTEIQISADAAPTGQEFDAWTGDTFHLADPSASTTTVTMPSADITVSATYKDLPQEDVIVAAINAGGGAFTGNDGTAYSADTNFSGGTIYLKNNAIAGTEDDVLYQSERYGNFSYNIPVENGDYSVVLKFAEIYWTAAGKRVFDASIEGNEVISDLDIFSQVGTNAAHDVTIPVTVEDGLLNISFNTVINNAKVSAIVVVKLGTTPQVAPAEEFAVASAAETVESDQALYPVIPSGQLAGPSLAESENKTGYKVGTLLTRDELHMAYIEKPWGIRLELGTLGGENSYAFSINDEGTVFGVAQKADGTYHAFKYSKDDMLDVGKLGNVENWNLAQGINAGANMVGVSTDADGNEKPVVFGNAENAGDGKPTGWCLESDGKLEAVFWDEAEAAN